MGGGYPPTTVAGVVGVLLLVLVGAGVGGVAQEDFQGAVLQGSYGSTGYKAGMPLYETTNEPGNVDDSPNPLPPLNQVHPARLANSVDERQHEREDEATEEGDKDDDQGETPSRVLWVLDVDSKATATAPTTPTTPTASTVERSRPATPAAPADDPLLDSLGFHAGTVNELTSEAAFQSLVMRAHDRVVVVEFSTGWCRCCQALAPQLAELATEFPGVVFARVDFDALRSLAEAQGATLLPTVNVYREGVVQDRLQGDQPDRIRTDLLANLAPPPSHADV